MLKQKKRHEKRSLYMKYTLEIMVLGPRPNFSFKFSVFPMDFLRPTANFLCANLNDLRLFHAQNCLGRQRFQDRFCRKIVIYSSLESENSQLMNTMFLSFRRNVLIPCVNP